MAKNRNGSAIGAETTQASSLLKAMANVHRLRMLMILLEGQKTVTELVDTTGLKQSTVSQHLARLREDGLVIALRDSRHRIYAVNSTPAKAVIKALQDSFEDKKMLEKEPA